jgi:hypothetical protein
VCHLTLRDAPGRRNPLVIGGNGSTSKMLQSLEEVLVWREPQKICGLVSPVGCVCLGVCVSFLRATLPNDTHRSLAELCGTL